MDAPNQQTSADIKKLVIFGLSEVPEVGGVLALFADLFWPEDNTDPLAQVKIYVQQMMQQILDQVKVQEVEDQFMMLESHFIDIKNATSPQAISDAEKGLYAKSTEVRSIFEKYGSTSPCDTLPYLVAFGTIRLQCMRDLVLDYGKVYLGATDSNPAHTKQVLKDEIVALKGWVEKGRASAMQKRDAINIQVLYYNSAGYSAFPAGQHLQQKWRVTDTYDSSFTRDCDSAFQANMCKANRQWDLFTGNDGFASKLDQLIDAYRFWDFFDPDTPYKPSPGPFYLYTRMGDGYDQGDFFNHALTFKQHGPMTKLNFWWDGGALKGLQVWYGDFDSGLVGVAQGSSGTYNFGGQVISVIGGRANNYVERFYYNTNSRKANSLNVMGPAPVSGDFAWQPEIHDPAEPGDLRVAYFEGINAAALGRITQLKVAWLKAVEYNPHLGKENMPDWIDLSEVDWNQSCQHQ